MVVAMKGSCMTQLKATIFRNYLQKKRNPKNTIKEILIPFYFLILIVILQISFKTTNIKLKETSEKSSFSLSLLQNLSNKIFYTPKSKENQEYLKKLNLLASAQSLHPFSFTDSDSFEVLTPVLQLSSSSISLRIPSSVFTSSICFESICPSFEYLSSGLANLQYSLHQSVIQKFTNYTLPPITISSFPQSFTNTTQNTDSILSYVTSLVPLYFVLAYSQFLTPLLLLIVGDKEKGHQKFLKLSGLRPWLYFLSWFLLYGALHSFVSSVFCLSLFLLSLLSYRFICLFLLLSLSFGLSMISFSFILAGFFSKAKPAAMFGPVIVLLLSLLYKVSDIAGKQGYHMISGVSYLLSPSVYAIGLDRLLKAQYLDENISYWTFETHELPLGGIILLLNLNTLFYFIIGVYLNQMLPIDFEAQRNWNIFVSGKNSRDVKSKSFKFICQGEKQQVQVQEEEEDENEENVEKLVSDDIVIETYNLGKTFKPFNKPVVEAVSGLSIQIARGEITALLGHNGAGKTTLLNILTGMTSDFKGSLVLLGSTMSQLSLRQKIASEIGFATQSNLLFDELTPLEHLTYFATLRGLPKNSIPCHVSKILAETQLETDAYKVCSQLSGGGKRKLSLGIALIGEPQIIFLDEPTAGIDAYSKRFIWNLLKEKKKDKAIVVSTHFMEEADAYADRIAILSHGQLRCYGSSRFLKNKFGEGSLLTISGLSSCHLTPLEITRLIQTEDPDAIDKRHGLTDSSLSFTLSSSPSKYFRLFKTLESFGLRLQISSPTLEEVFLRLQNQEERSYESLKNNFQDCFPTNQKFEILKSFRQTYFALLHIRILTLCREPSFCVFALLFPYIQILIASSAFPLIAKNISETLNSSSLKFSQSLPYYIWSNETVVPFMKTLNDNDFHHVSLERQISSPTACLHFSYTSLNIAINSSFPTILPLLLHDLLTLIRNYYSHDSSDVSVTFEISVIDQTQGFFGKSLLLGSIYTSTAIGMALLIIEEKETGIRDVLRVNGINSFLYFSSFFTVTGSLLFFLWTSFLIVIQISEDTALTHFPSFLILASFYFLCIPMCIVFTAALSLLFNSVESGQFLYPLITYMGIVPFSLNYLLDTMNFPEYFVLSHILCIFLSPPYIPFSIIYILNRHYVFCLYRQSCRSEYLNSLLFVPEIIGILLGILTHTLLWSFVLKMSQLRQTKNGCFERRVKCELRGVTETPSEKKKKIDEDVSTEKLRITSENGAKYALSVISLSKSYTSGFLAFQNLSFGIEGGEIFGLLGSNGAGKTSLLRTILSLESKTSGSVKIDGQESGYFDSKDQLNLAYCPQFDSLWRKITLKEHMVLYATMKGIQSKDKDSYITSLLNCLQIESKTQNSYAVSASGGTRRKLSLGLCLMEQRNVLLLDEPTTGIDPEGKRIVWKHLSEARKRNQGVLFTTHSLEEANAISTKLGILVKGELKCIGSPQHLKNKFGNVYILEIQWKFESSMQMSYFEEALELRFKDVKYIETLGSRRMFEIPSSSLQSLSQSFKILEEWKIQFEFEDYYLSQCTLEHVFINFAKLQYNSS